MHLVDTHCHLSFEPLADDLDGVLSRAAAAGVAEVVAPAYDGASWPVLQRIARHPDVHIALGLHPWRADEDLDLDHLEQELRSARAVAVGEIGLDSKVAGIDRDRQLAVLRAQLGLALDLDLPVILHCRGAFDELVDAIGAHAPRLRGVVHAYSRGPELARRLVGLGLHIAFGGAVTRPRAKRARRSAKVVPADRLLLETDAPSIGLDGVDPPDTEPRHVLEVATALAAVRGEDLADVARQTTSNAHALFGI
jgi:TatD DNase family protein